MSGNGSRRLPVSWTTVGLLAVVLAYADGFWLTSLRGATGAIQHIQAPVRGWVVSSALMAPVFVAGIAGALWLTHRWVHDRRTVVRALVGAALVVIVTSGISAAHASVSAAQDYSAQSRQLATLHSAHVATTPAGIDAVPAACSPVCEARKLTLEAHVKGIGLVTAVVLLTNLVLLGWVVALRGGRLWAAPLVAADGRVPAPPAMAGALR